MNGELPLETADRQRIDVVADLLHSTISGRSAIYVAVPITTGKRFMIWYAKTGAKLDRNGREYREAHNRDVIQPNVEGAKRFIADLRARSGQVVIDPSAFERPEWNQDEYRYFWSKVLERFADTVYFRDGWEYSAGCAIEFLTATRCGVSMLTEDSRSLDRDAGLALLSRAVEEIKRLSVDTSFLERMIGELAADSERLTATTPAPRDADRAIAAAADDERNRRYFKDEILDRLSSVANIAQFVSFEPDAELSQRFSRIHGFEPNYRFPSAKSAVEALLEKSPDGAVNVRSFRPDRAKGEPLEYGLKTVQEVLDVVKQKAAEGKHTIVNETVDVNDGGISGVAVGNVLEFAPRDTPKCVDKPGVAGLPREVGLRLLQSVYSFWPAINYDPKIRVEFSIHPKKRGLRREHTIIWELEELNEPISARRVVWPNNFSRMLGDKAYGLLVADALGLPVPRTTVISRSVAPFTFGRQTDTQETWLRTCPEESVPGKFPTKYGWCDPFEMMAHHDNLAGEDAGKIRIASVLAQEAVNPEYSGSLAPTEGEDLIIDGVRGPGDLFMLGKQPKQALPDEVIRAVQELYRSAFKHLGKNGIEWVYDGKIAWVVQLRLGGAVVDAYTIVAGEPANFHRLSVHLGLDALRDLISRIEGTSDGIILVGDVGATSHFAHTLTDAGIPSRIERSASDP